MLMMVFCDREGRVYDVWITFGSVHEVRAFRERKKRSLWFRGLVFSQYPVYSLESVSSEDMT